MATARWVPRKGAELTRMKLACARTMRHPSREVRDSSFTPDARAPPTRRTEVAVPDAPRTPLGAAAHPETPSAASRTPSETPD
jgi:hypothetical protein